MAKGYEVHGGLLRVYFEWRGKKCREPLELPATDKNRAYAENLAAAIRHEIRSGTFDYSRYFPGSTQLKELAFGTWIDLLLEIKETQVAPSTIANYKRWARGHIKPKWGKRQSDKIDGIEIQEWITKDLSGLSNKSINEILVLMRQTFRLFRQRNKMAVDPTEGIRVTLPDDEDPDPFTLEEIEAICSCETYRPGDVNLAKFSIWTGPRPSEVLALGWDDVDLKRGEVLFRRAVVMNGYKSTKTRRSKRVASLLTPALDALREQIQITGNIKPMSIDILQRDNRTIRKELFRPVFINQSTGRPYTNAKTYPKSFWINHLEKAGVRYRGPSNCRHTFASQMLTAGMDRRWICDQMGHTSDAMLNRKYGKFIREDSIVDYSDIANKSFGF